ncbi:DUF3152 domain-containing protein [Terrabacter sp. NPDC080008]|uniref:DUF3152 domain-containing protein n=1 Tax=Terrabacter sp. NPDC080008 TaxID=3155176 RepID=UPI00344F2210
MATSRRADRPTPAQGRAIRRRRSWAALAVVLCITADAWSVWSSVPSASAGEPMADRPAPQVSSTASASPTPRDEAEQVPDAGADSPVGGSSTAAGKGKGDGKDAKGAVIELGSGRFTVVAMPASALRPEPSSGRTVRYTVELEGGLDVSATDFATTVGSVLTDPRGWQTEDGVRFVNVAPAEAAKGAKVDLRITLASPDTTDRLCAPLETRGQVSCHNGGRVVLNLRRWVLGAEAYGKDIAGYRTYLVNHEVGHGIGHPHEYCGGKGKVAPVMMQQTYGLKGCTAWPWPTPKPA